MAGTASRASSICDTMVCSSSRWTAMAAAAGAGTRLIWASMLSRPSCIEAMPLSNPPWMLPSIVGFMVSNISLESALHAETTVVTSEFFSCSSVSSLISKLPSPLALSMPTSMVR